MYTTLISTVDLATHLGDPTWVQLDVDFVATVETTSVTDHLSRPHRFYQVWQMD